MPTCLFRPKPYLERPIGNFLFDSKLQLFKTIQFGKGLGFLKNGFIAILKYVKTPKTVGKQILL